MPVDGDDLTNFLDDTGEQEKQRRSPLSSSLISWMGRSYLEDSQPNTLVKWFLAQCQFRHCQGMASTDSVSGALNSSDT